MSLTSFLAIPKVKARFKQEWPMPLPRPKSRDWLMVAPPVSSRPSIIGTAFDYVLRFHLRRLNPMTEQRETWVADGATGLLKGDLQKKAKTICETARKRYELFLTGEPLHDDLLASAVQLAQVDVVYRAGYIPPSGDFDVLPEDITDLRQLVEACDWTQWRASENCYLNPAFGMSSVLVGGADADFQLDSTLYEIKTVRAATVSLEHYHQLIGYPVLNFLNEGPPIDELAVYYSRFAQVVSWPAPRLGEDQYEPFLSWFSKTADDVFRLELSLSDVDNTPSKRSDIAFDNYTELETEEGYFTPYCDGCDTTFLFWFVTYVGGRDSETVNCPNCGQNLGMLETESKLLGQMKGDVGDEIDKLRPPPTNR